jgi:hypothetical protein
MLINLHRADRDRLVVIAGLVGIPRDHRVAGVELPSADRYNGAT